MIYIIKNIYSIFENMLYVKYKKRKMYILTDNNIYVILYAQVQEIRTVAVASYKGCVDLSVQDCSRTLYRVRGFQYDGSGMHPTSIHASFCMECVN